MPSEFSQAVPLVREVVAVSLDPLTNRDLTRGVVPAGTLVENPYGAILAAMARGDAEVVVRARELGGSSA